MKRILVILIISTFLFADGTTKVATSTAQFLKIGVGARGVGMGSAYSAVAEDVSAIYWNPAGLVNVKANTLYFSQVQWLAGMDYSFFALSAPVGQGNIGMYVSSLTVPEDEVTTVLQPEGTGEFFDAGNFAIAGTYSRAITDKFSIGMNAKYIVEQIWSMTSHGFGVDIGTLYQSSWHDLKIGIVLNNFGSKMRLTGRANLLYVDPDPVIEGNIDAIRAQLEMGGWDIPMNLKTSISMVVLKTSFLKLLVAMDMVHPNDNMEYYNFGTELAISDMVFVRGGYRGYGIDESEGGLSLGAGANVKLSSALGLVFDYAYVDYGRLESVNQFSFSVKF